MERVDAVEAGLRRLAMEDSVIVEEDEDEVRAANTSGDTHTAAEAETEEVDVGMTASTTLSHPVGSVPNEGSSTAHSHPPTSPPMSPNVSSNPAMDATLLHGNYSHSASSSEEDLVAMSKSVPQLDFSRDRDVPASAPFHHTSWSNAEQSGGRDSGVGNGGVEGGATRPSLEWMRDSEEDGTRKKIMIVEVC
jgi:hypothetical protein